MEPAIKTENPQLGLNSSNCGFNYTFGYAISLLPMDEQPL